MYDDDYDDEAVTHIIRLFRFQIFPLVISLSFKREAGREGDEDGIDVFMDSKPDNTCVFNTFSQWMGPRPSQRVTD